MKMYEKGTVKVVWIEDNLQRIYSQMFNTVEEAKIFGMSKKNYVIYSLVKQEDMKTFEWQILPFGKYKLYSWTLRVYFFLTQKLLNL